MFTLEVREYFQVNFQICIKKYTITNHVRIGTIIGPSGFVLPDQDNVQGFRFHAH